MEEEGLEKISVTVGVGGQSENLTTPAILLQSCQSELGNWDWRNRRIGKHLQSAYLVPRQSRLVGWQGACSSCVLSKAQGGQRKLRRRVFRILRRWGLRAGLIPQVYYCRTWWRAVF